jgi:thioredoxin 1
MLELTNTNFKKETSKGIVVVDFWAEWCGPCKMMSPVFESLSKDIETMKFAKVNVDAEQSIASEFGVQSIPTLLILKDGKEIERMVGMQPKPMLKAKLEEIK